MIKFQGTYRCDVIQQMYFNNQIMKLKLIIGHFVLSADFTRTWSSFTLWISIFEIVGFVRKKKVGKSQEDCTKVKFISSIVWLTGASMDKTLEPLSTTRIVLVVLRLSKASPLAPQFGPLGLVSQELPGVAYDPQHYLEGLPCPNKKSIPRKI